MGNPRKPRSVNLAVTVWWWRLVGYGPNMGALGFGYELAEQLGLDVLDRSAALVSLTFSDQWKSLYGHLLVYRLML